MPLEVTIATLRHILPAMARLHGPLMLFRCAIALLVLMIAVHALTPVGPPVQRLAGSAFNAATVDVSLRVDQRTAIVKSAETPKLPVVTAPVPSVIASIGLFPAARVPTPSSLGQTGPPQAARSSFSPLSPRAPPAA